MKKILVLLAAVIVAATASAQKVSSTTYFKEKSKTTWYARLGVSFDNFAGAGDLFDGIDDASFGSKAGMDFDLGFQKNIGKSGLYWGMELGLGTRGGSVKAGDDKEDYLFWNAKWSPFTIGYKYSVTDDIKIDGHLGGFVSYDFAGKSKSEINGKKDESSIEFLENNNNFHREDGGIQVGVGVWWRNLNLDLTYQRGFATMMDFYDGNGDSHSATSSNLMLRVGVAF